MTKEMPKSGKQSLNMMYQTSGTQINIDYLSEEDFKKKIKIISYLCQITIGVLDNSAISETKPTVADVSQTIAPATATTISITGTGFVSIPIVDFINASTGAITRANTVSFTNATTLSVNCTLASGNYFIRIEYTDGNARR